MPEGFHRHVPRIDLTRVNFITGEQNTHGLVQIHQACGRVTGRKIPQHLDPAVAKINDISWMDHRTLILGYMGHAQGNIRLSQPRGFSAAPKFLLAQLRHIDGAVVKQIIRVSVIPMGMGIGYQQRLICNILPNIAAQIKRRIGGVDQQGMGLAHQQMRFGCLQAAGAVRNDDPGDRLGQVHGKPLVQGQFHTSAQDLNLQFCHGFRGVLHMYSS